MKFGVLAICLCIPSTVFGEIYKWVDSNGQVHYGESPAGQASQEIVIPRHDAGTAAAGADEDQRRENVRKWVDARQQEREQKKREQQEQDRQREARRKECAELRRELRDMEVGGVSWYRLDEAGERQFYSDAEIAEAIKNKRAVLEEHCS